MSIAPGGYLLVANTADFTAFRNFYGVPANVAVVGPFVSSSLNNGGETITLKTSFGGLDIVSFTYSDARGWPLAADGLGHSLVLLDSAETTQGSGSSEYGGSWRASSFIKGSAGRADSGPVATLVLNEIAANTTGDGDQVSNDWVELFNNSDTAFSIGTAWFLSDDGLNLKKWQIPTGTLVPARGFVTFDEMTGFNNPPGAGFEIDKSGKQLFLSYLPGTAEDQVVDTVRFKAQEQTWSWGRYPDGGSFWAALNPRSPNSTNTLPPSRVVVSEILFHPTDIGGTNDNVLDEFVEIYNPGPSVVALSNSNGSWRVDGGISFSFPPGQVLGAGEFLLLASFSPTNISQLAAFKSLYGITNGAILGPYIGKLANSSDRVAIEKPQATDNPIQPIAWVVVDEVFYADQPPWPCGSDGTGASLQRQNARSHGSDPNNWGASTPTAGRSNIVQIAGAPTITSQPAGRVVAVGSGVSFNVAACGNPPFSYQWRFNNTYLPFQTNSTLMLTNVQVSQSGGYDVLVSSPYGSELSRVALLVVQSVPVIVAHPLSQAVLVSTNVTLSVDASGSAPLFYQWRFNGTNLAGATNQNLVLTNVQTTQAGPYSVLVMNTAGSLFSSNAFLTVLVPVQIITSPPVATNFQTGGSLNLQVAAIGTAPLLYQWYFEGNPLPGKTNVALVIPSLQFSNAGLYRVSVSNFFSGEMSGNTDVSVLDAPGFTQQPTSQSVLVGSTVTITAGVTGSPPMWVRWLKGSAPVTAYASVTSSIITLTLQNVQSNDSGFYRAVVTNAVRPSGSSSSLASLTVLFPPSITAHPTSRAVKVSSNAVFAVTAAGTAPFSYQWQRNGSNLPGATNSLLNITNVQLALEGEYHVTVTNAYGAATSLSAAADGAWSARPE